MKFKNYIETESGIKDTSTSPGTAGQLLSSTVAGTSWIDQNTISSGTSEVVDIQVKNISSANGGINLSKGDPVYIYGSVGASARLYVDLADADSTATNNLGDGKMPCVGLLDQDLSPNGEGTATVVGKLRNLITNPIDGDVPNENDTVYVKSGGGLTLTKPTGSTNLIQNVGQVGRVSTSNDGNIVVAALLRSNDVPNLPEGRIWIGDGNTIVSDTVYVDEPNNRVGINTAMPTYDLDVDGAIRASEGFIDNEDNSALRVVSPPGGSFRSAFTTVGAIEVTIPNSYVKNDVTFTLEVREGGLTAYTIKIAMRGNIGIDLFPYVVSAYLTSDANKDNNCTIKYESLVPEFDDVKIYVQNPSLGFPSNTGVFITEFTVPATVADGNLAWGLNITSVPAEANATFSNTQVTNWKRNGQDLYYGSGSGNVGIGTTSPGAYKLAVAGSTAIGENLQVSDGLGGDRTLDIDAPNGAFRIGDIDGIADEAYIEGTGSTIRISNSGGLTLIADSNQNVGIGAPIPSQKLHVNGNARLTGLFYDGTNSGGASGQILSSDGVKTEWINGSAIPGVPAGSGTINYLARWTPDANTLGIGVTYDNGTNVGIGTIFPQAKLDVYGNLRLGTTGTFTIAQSPFLTTVFYVGAGNGSTITFGTPASNTQNVSVQGDLYSYQGSIGTKNSSASFNNKITYNGDNYLNSGNLGIGTTNPITSLTLGTGSSGISFQSSSTTINSGKIAVIKQVEVGNGNGHLAFETYQGGSGGGERMRILNDGNVGIGTTNPNSKLQVDGEIDANGGDGYRINGMPWAEESSNNLKLGDWDGQGFSTSIYDDNGAAIVTVKEYGTMISCSSLTSSYGADATLAVGLGTGGAAVLTLSNTDPNPSNAGDATGIIQFAIKDDQSGLGYTSASIRGSISQAAGQGNGGGGILDFYTAPWGTGNTPQPRMRINQLGQVGIGVTSIGTGFTLDVSGEIHSSTYVSATAGLGVDNTIGTLGRGISLYAGPTLYPQYGLLFAQTVDLGTYGGVSGDWATYMTMSGTATRGWIWKAGTTNSTAGNVASISGVGQLTLASTATATNFILSSDETLKDNIKEIDTKHVDVDWKNFELKSEPGIKRAGVIAQELEIKHPEFVRTADDGLKSVAYIDLLITKIAELEARLEKLEK